MTKIAFLNDAWMDYLYWQTQDKGALSGWWSRRIDNTNRLVYKVDKEQIIIAQCKTHYHDT